MVGVWRTRGSAGAESVMPELPEVETVRRSLVPALVGRRIESVDVFERRLRYPVRPARLRRACDQTIERLGRRAKYLLMHLEDATTIVVHLGMSGRLLTAPRGAPRPSHVHVTFGLSGGLELRFRDPRRFGLVDAVTTPELERDRRFAHLGVEPLSEAFDGRSFHERCRGVRRPIKNYLMDARQVVGVGNIYASEALFLAGIHPRRAAGSLSRKRWERLVASVKEVLDAAIEAGGTTLNDFQSGTGDAGYFQVQLRVYGREGEACLQCRSKVRRLVLAGRSTYLCGRCQR